jgi:hypothetical protein
MDEYLKRYSKPVKKKKKTDKRGNGEGRGKGGLQVWTEEDVMRQVDDFEDGLYNSDDSENAP